MNRLIILIIGFMFVLVTGCEFESYSDYAIKPYDGSLTFTNLTKKAEWKNRFDHAATVYDDKIWIFGGYNPGATTGDTYYEDVWSSEDGISWDLVSDKNPWCGRRGHKVVTFDDGDGEAMYLIGGYEVDEETGYRQYCNDVWKSTDGKRWDLLKLTVHTERDELNTEDSTYYEPKTWYPRMNHAVVTANHGGTNYIYIIGGRIQLEDHPGAFSQKYFNDVWRSEDGIRWEKLDNNDYGIRAGHAATVNPNTGTIYIQGGSHGMIFETPDNDNHPLKNWSDLWYSNDGINWSATYDTIVPVAYTEREEHEMVFYKNTIWVFPGSRTSSFMHYQFTSPYHYATWRVDEGDLWSIDSEGSDLRGRHSYATVIFKDKIYFLGGFTSNHGQNNDVWEAY